MLQHMTLCKRIKEYREQCTVCMHDNMVLNYKMI